MSVASPIDGNGAKHRNSADFCLNPHVLSTISLQKLRNAPQSVSSLLTSTPLTILGLMLHYMTRGKEDVDELADFFTTCGLFSPDTTHHCIVTGAVASTSVTVDDAQSTGMRLLKDMMDLEVREYIFPVSSKGKSLAARLEVEMNGEKVSVYLQLLIASIPL